LYFKTQIDKRKKLVKLVGNCFIGVSPTGSNYNRVGRVRSLAKHLKNIKPENKIRKKKN